MLGLVPFYGVVTGMCVAQSSNNQYDHLIISHPMIILVLRIKIKSFPNFMVPSSHIAFSLLLLQFFYIHATNFVHTAVENLSYKQPNLRVSSIVTLLL